MTSQVPSSNPYVGPRPFAVSERDKFFGREKEAGQLLHLVISERLVLFYAQSGAGKSSLINARLIPELEERRFCVLPIGRVSGQRETATDVDNPFVYNLLLSLHNKSIESAIPDSALAHTTLPEYLARLVIDETGPVVPGGGVRPLVLIIDQFEEIFTTHLGEWEKRDGFFEQLRQAQEADPYLWVVLAMREDFVARMDPYVYLLRDELRHRYYMERMSYPAALEAVKRPVERLRPFEAGVAEELVNNLRRIAPSEEPGSEPKFGQYIDPVQLQVVCYQLWEQLKAEAGAAITKGDLLRLAKGGDLVQFISSALADFYEQAIASAMEAMQDIPEGERVSERKLRDWFSTQLITKAGTCNLIFREKQNTGGMPNVIVDHLAAKFIIRPENRGSDTWYQLPHDRLIGPILEANLAWYARNPHPIQANAEAWAASGKSPDRLYEGRQLVEALPLLDDPQADLSETERAFIQASQIAANQRQARRVRFVIFIFALVLLVLTGLAGYSQFQKNIADQQRQTAEAASAKEAQQRQTAEAASGLANQQRQTAVAASAQEAQQRQTAEAAARAAEAASTQEAQQRQKAVEAAEESERAKATAQAANLQSQSSRLSSLSDYFRDTNLDLSLLLAVESSKISNNSLESRRALLNSIQSSVNNRVTRPGSPWYVDTRPYSAAFSPDGTIVAVGALRHVYLWDTTSGEQVNNLPDSFKEPYSMYAVAFDATGNLLARGGGDGNVIVWDRQAKTQKSFRPFRNFEYTSILSIAFQPGGSLLAVSTDVYQGTGKGQVYLYNYTQDKQETAYKLNCGGYACVKVAWSPDGSRLAIAGRNGQLQVIDVAKNEILWTIARAHSNEISGLAWYPDGRRLVTSGYDQRLIQWDTDAHNAPRQVSLANKSAPITLALSPDGRFLLAGVTGPGNWFGLWNAETLQKLDFKQFGHTRPVTAVAFSPQSDRFVTTGYDFSVNLWDFAPVDSLGPTLLNLNNSGIQAVGTDSAGRLVFAHNLGGALLDVLTEGVDKPVNFQASHAGLAYVWQDRRPAIVLGGMDGRVSFIDPTSGNNLRDPVMVAKGTVRSLAVSGDGRLLATASCQSERSCDQITINDLQTGQPLLLKGDLSQFRNQIITSVALNADGGLLAIGDSTGKIIRYDIATGQTQTAVTEGLSLQKVNVPVTHLLYSPTEQGLLIAGFKDGRIALWDANTNEPVGEFVERMNSEVTGLLERKNPDTGLWTLVSVSGKGEVREWEIDPAAWVARACRIAGRNLNADEKAKFLLPGMPQEDVCPAK